MLSILYYSSWRRKMRTVWFCSSILKERRQSERTRRTKTPRLSNLSGQEFSLYCPLRTSLFYREIASFLLTAFQCLVLLKSFIQKIVLSEMMTIFSWSYHEKLDLFVVSKNFFLYWTRSHRYLFPCLNNWLQAIIENTSKRERCKGCQLLQKQA